MYLQSVETAGRRFLISLLGVQGGLPNALGQVLNGHRVGWLVGWFIPFKAGLPEGGFEHSTRR